MGVNGGGTLGEGVGEASLCFIQRLREAVADLFVLGKGASPGFRDGLHGAIETLGDAVEVASELPADCRLLGLRGLGEYGVAGVDGREQCLRAFAKGVGNLADGLIEAGGDALEVAGQRGGQLLLAGGGGFGQRGVLLRGVGL